MKQKNDDIIKDKIETFLEVNLLYDFYGKLLTKRQCEFIELYYTHDLSLGEIAEQFLISRQGVYDIIKRAEKVLKKYEEKLGLVKKFQGQKVKLQKIYKMLTRLEKLNENDLNREINNIKKYIEELI